jgi:HEAT repeat protein
MFSWLRGLFSREPDYDKLINYYWKLERKEEKLATRSAKKYLRAYKRKKIKERAIIEKLVGNADVQKLIDDLSSKTVLSRVRAARTLGLLQVANAVVPLVSTIKSSQIKIEHLPEITYTLSERDIYEIALQNIGQKAVDPLIDMLKNKDDQGIAVRMLGYIRDQKAVDSLLPFLKTGNSSLRESTIEALGNIADHRAMPYICEALKDSNSDVRNAAAKALALIGDPKAVPLLINSLKDGDIDVRTTVARALGVIGSPQAIKALRTALMDEESYIDDEAVEALSLRGEGDIHSIKNAGDAQALGMIGDRNSVPALIEALRDSAYVRTYAIEALGDIGDTTAVQPLIEALEQSIKEVEMLSLRTSRLYPNSAKYIESKMELADAKMACDAAKNVLESLELKAGI